MHSVAGPERSWKKFRSGGGGFERETMGPDRLVTGGNYGRVTKYLAGKCRELRLNTVVEKVDGRREKVSQAPLSIGLMSFFSDCL